MTRLLIATFLAATAVVLLLPEFPRRPVAPAAQPTINDPLRL